ncbi:tetracycline resistance protein [Fusarium heterosporum]|uniref:Tetracycline resistance protein n=1 Tax=Fusarium heterosporum TaxID=42747 RepID=A0A8H5T4Z6_FUSHE|nr:tetracycline resistance protein [Fusarium heterosporum]
MASSAAAPIAIIGGGPCGLTLARLFETAGINYVVFERSESPKPTARGQGGTLDIHAKTGQEALRRAGLYEQFKSLARCDATVMTLMDPRGESRASYGDENSNDRPEIDRQQLQQILLDSLPADRIRWGKILDSVAKDETENRGGAYAWKLKFRDGSTECGFRLIVGADGAWSKIRPLITDAKPIYSGKMLLEGRISPGNPQYTSAQQMAGKGMATALSAKSTLTIQQMSDSSYRVYMGIVAPESLLHPGGDVDPNDMDKARKTMTDGFYAGWADDFRVLVENSEGPWRPWPLYRLDPEIFSPETTSNGCQNGEPSQNSWKRTLGVVLIGDAAHLATPNGEGVNQAMYDSLVLFDQIISKTGVTQEGTHDWEADAAALEQAVAAYEAEMRPRACEHIKDSIDMESMMYAENGVEQMKQMMEGFANA